MVQTDELWFGALLIPTISILLSRNILYLVYIFYYFLTFLFLFHIVSYDTTKIVHLGSHVSITIYENYVRGRHIVKYLQDVSQIV